MQVLSGLNIFCLPAILAVLFYGVPAEMNSIDQPEEAVLKFKLEAQADYAAGQAVNIKFTLENVSHEALYVLTWYTPLEGLKGKIFKVTRNGEEIPYEGRMIKRGNPAREDYMRIGPGESASATVDLSSGYNLGAPGEYRIEYKGRIHDVAREGEPLPRTQDSSRGMDVQGNAVAFCVHD
jgi:hypothetical protein